VRTGEPYLNTMKGSAVMGLFLLLFFAVVAVAGAFSRVADSRDFADWRPTDDGLRRSPR
jgi:hypothetical protein